MTANLICFLEQLFFSLNVTGNLHERRVEGYFGLNQQLYDLGLSKQDLFNMDLIKVFKFWFKLSNFIKDILKFYDLRQK